MKQEIIVQQMNIHHRAQIHYFQMNIPGHVLRITGIQVGLRADGPTLPAEQHWQAGTLTLQAEGRMNLCYNLAVMAEPPVAPKYDLGFSMMQAGFIQPTTLIQDAIAQRGRSSFDPVSIPKCRMIYGVYRDGNQWSTATSYDLTLTIWTQVNIIPTS
jgi:hypothetical protein